MDAEDGGDSLPGLAGGDGVDRPRAAAFEFGGGSKGSAHRGLDGRELTADSLRGLDPIIIAYPSEHNVFYATMYFGEGRESLFDLSAPTSLRPRTLHEVIESILLGLRGRLDFKFFASSGAASAGGRPGFARVASSGTSDGWR